MATIKFQLLSESETAPIYLRLSIKRGLTPRTKTGLHISPKDWSTANFPKTTTATNKKLKSDLVFYGSHDNDARTFSVQYIVLNKLDFFVTVLKRLQEVL
jgi:hypothetical protein